MSAEVGDLLRWADGLQKAPGRLGAEVAKEARDTGSEVAEISEDTAPHDTGELSESIEVQRVGSGRSSEIFVRVVATAKHAHLVHYGTSRMRPRPWQDQALASVEEAHVGRLRRIVEEVIPDE